MTRPDPHPVAAVTASRPAAYTVRSGDTLASVARREYGTAAAWPALWWANRGTVRNPDVIIPGQHLALSGWHPVKAVVTARAMAAIPRPRPAPAVLAVHSSAPAAPRAPPAAVPVSYAGGGFEACVIRAESGGNPVAYNPASGASGLFGFLLSTWDSLGLGYPGGAYTAPVAVQMRGFQIEYARSGTSPWAPWDGC